MLLAEPKDLCGLGYQPVKFASRPNAIGDKKQAVFLNHGSADARKEARDFQPPPRAAGCSCRAPAPVLKFAAALAAFTAVAVSPSASAQAWTCTNYFEYRTFANTASATGLYFGAIVGGAATGKNSFVIGCSAHAAGLNPIAPGSNAAGNVIKKT